MKNNINIAFALLILVLFSLSACNKFEFSPFQTEVANNMPKDLNNKNIIKLMAMNEKSDDTVTIAYSGDSQRYYDRLEYLVKKINEKKEIDFFVLSGDIADFGILNEFLWIEERLDQLKIPFFCVIGNHDLAADNGEVYSKMFGAKNFAFTYKRYKFIFHDTNGREYGFNGTIPNLPWLTAQLNDSSPSWFLGFSHVPPYSIDFDSKLEMDYKNIFATEKRFIASLNGHNHDSGDTYFYSDSVRYITSNSVAKSEFILLKLIHGKIIKQKIRY